MLQHLCKALHRHSAVLIIAVGEPDTLDQAELVICPQAVDPETAALTYRPHDLANCPTVTVPWQRIIALHDAW